jgi:hypothetical protein
VHLLVQRAGLRGEKGERRFAAEVEYDSTWGDEKLAFHTYVLNGGDLVWQRQVGQKVPTLSAHSTRVHASRNQWPAVRGNDSRKPNRNPGAIGAAVEKPTMSLRLSARSGLRRESRSDGIDDEGVFASRTMLRLNIGFGPAQLYEEPLK